MYAQGNVQAQKNPKMTLSLHRNGNPLQYSCLENPMDGGAWWAAIYRVAQSRTRLKRLSSSSSRATKQQHYLFPELSALISLRMLLIELVLLEDGITKWLRAWTLRPP